MFDVVRKSLHLIGRDHRGRWLLLVVLAVVASGLEMLGALLVYLLLAMVADPGGDLALPLIGDARRFAGELDETSLLLTLALAMAAFFVIRFLVHVGVTYAYKRVAYRAGARVAKRLAAGYLALPYAFHLRRNTAESIRNANAAGGLVVAQAFLPLIRVAADSIMTLGLLVVMFLASPLATVLAIGVVGGAAGVLLWVVQPRLKRLGGVVHWMSEAILRALQTGLAGLRDIKLLGRERAFVAVYGGGIDQLARAMYLRGTVGELPRLVMETALVGFILVFFGIAVMGGSPTEEILSVLGLFAYAGLRLQPSLNRILAGLNELKFASASVDGVHGDLALIEGLVAPPEHGAPRPFEHELALHGVTFRYDGTDQDALTDVDLVIRRGETIGICGPTGSGKTTLIDVITGLLEPTSGSVTLDGRPLDDDVRGWQANLGVVAQMPFFTDQTLRQNIALGVPDDQIDDEAVHDAIRLAQLDEFVARSTDGIDTHVGERGVRVSGGQRQRIAIARALYRRARVLILDEGTSALDTTTEANLMAALAQLRRDHTIILVAHRLSTVRDCDRIVFVVSGRIADVGSYDQLLQRSEGFRALARSAPTPERA